MNRLLPALAAVALFACGPLPAATVVAVADQPAALTSGGDDVLFQLTLSDADEPINVADIEIYAGLPGQTATVVNFTHQDTNNDGKLNVGETLTTREPGVNLFDATQVGKTFNVGFSLKSSTGTWVTRANSTWVPAQ